MTTDEAETQTPRQMAIKSNGRCWELLGMSTPLTTEEQEEMLEAAHASAFHWRTAGTVVHQARAQWLIAKVNSELGYGEAAIRHAERCAELTNSAPGEMKDFDRFYASEGLTRAHAISGDHDKAAAHHATTTELLQAIEGEEDRAIATADLADGNWGDYSRPE